MTPSLSESEGSDQGVTGGSQAVHSAIPEPLDLDNFDTLLQLCSSDRLDSEIAREIAKHLERKVSQSALSKQYRVLYLYDDRQEIDQSFSEAILGSPSVNADRSRGILLMIHSSGGQIEPAYLLSKVLKKSTDGKFVVCVPRRAKSAATLLALGADELHMGVMGEIGPIDPQVRGLPLLGLQNSMEFLAELSCRSPQSSEMLARFLSLSLNLQILGYSQRVPESAVQYAERLLRNKAPLLPKPETPQSIAKKLVYDYKDHRFVIDYEEAQQLLGGFVMTGTPEAELAQDVYRFIELTGLVLGFTRKRYFRIVGDPLFGAYLGQTRD